MKLKEKCKILQKAYNRATLEKIALDLLDYECKKEVLKHYHFTYEDARHKGARITNPKHDYEMSEAQFTVYWQRVADLRKKSGWVGPDDYSTNYKVQKKLDILTKAIGTATAEIAKLHPQLLRGISANDIKDVFSSHLYKEAVDLFLKMDTSTIPA